MKTEKFLVALWLCLCDLFSIIISGNITYPSPRFGSSMVVRQNIAYLFGGMFEDEEDRQLTFNDFYSLDIRKMDTWQTIIESDIKTMEWFESEDDEDDDDEDDEDEEASADMDIN